MQRASTKCLACMPLPERARYATLGLGVKLKAKEGTINMANQAKCEDMTANRFSLLFSNCNKTKHKAS